MTKTPEREQMPPIILPMLVLGTMSPYLYDKTTTSLLSREKWTKKQAQRAAAMSKITTIRLVTVYCCSSITTTSMNIILISFVIRYDELTYSFNNHHATIG